MIRDENYDGFDVLFTNCTKSVWRAPIVYRGPVWETMGVSIKGGIDHDTISTAILSRDGGHSPSRCSALQQNAQFEQNKTKVQCNQMHQFEQNAMLLKFTLVPPCFYSPTWVLQLKDEFDIRLFESLGTPPKFGQRSQCKEQKNSLCTAVYCVMHKWPPWIVAHSSRGHIDV